MMSSSDDNSVSFVRRRPGGRVIIDSSDEEEDNHSDSDSNASHDGIEEASTSSPALLLSTVTSTVVRPQQRVLDDLDSDSDDSFDALLSALKVSNDPVERQEETELVDIHDDSDIDEMSVAADSIDSTDDLAPTAKEEKDAGIEKGSAYALDRTRRHVNLSSDKDESVEWPNFSVPVTLFRRLYNYQKSGVQWMGGLYNDQVGGVLGDDMGMGKTYMTLTYLGGLMRAGTIRNALIIAPLSVLRAWEKEGYNVLAMCVPNVVINVISGDVTRPRRQRVLQEALDCASNVPHLVISTYGTVQSSTADFQDDELHWDYVVLDEGHEIKNHKATKSVRCRDICLNEDTRRLLLTGTPILNNLQELWAVFDWATSGEVLGDLRDFKKRFAKPIEASRDKNASEGTLQRGQRANEELQALLKPYFLQRLKVDYLSDQLPSKNEVVLWTHLSDEQRATYTEFVNSKDVRSILSEKTSPLTAVTWLKKLCGHPLLANNGDEDAEHYSDLEIECIINQSAKLSVLVDLIDDFRSNGHRTLIFSQSTKMLDIIEHVLCDVSLARIDGKTPGKDRQTIVDNFNGSSEVEAILLSTKAAGVGLTLTGADRVVIYDPSWTPAEDNQAVDRCYRIGQHREVLVYRMITAGTVEEKMYEKQVHKDGIRRMVFTEGVSVERHFDKQDLSKLFALAPRGVCRVKDQVEEAAKGQQIKWDARQQSVLALTGVVGLSPHDGFYNQKEDEAQEEETPPDFKIPRKKVLGKSQRVLQNDNTNTVPVGQSVPIEIKDDDREKENAVVDLVSSPVAGAYKGKAEEVDLCSPEPLAVDDIAFKEERAPSTPCPEDDGAQEDPTSIDALDDDSVMDAFQDTQVQGSPGITDNAVQDKEPTSIDTLDEDFVARAFDDLQVQGSPGIDDDETVPYEEDPTLHDDVVADAFEDTQVQDSPTRNADMVEGALVRAFDSLQVQGSPGIADEDVEDEEPTLHDDFAMDAFEASQEQGTPEEVANAEAVETAEPTADDQDGGDDVATIFQRAEWFEANGQPRRALKLLQGLLYDPYNGLDREQKIELHAQVCLLAEPMGLLEE